MAANDDAKELKSIVDALNTKVKEVNDSLKSTASLVGESINPFKEILNISDQLNAHKTKENQLTSDQLKKLSEKIQKERQNLKDSETALASRLTKLKEIQLEQEKDLTRTKKSKKAYKEVQKALEGTLAE
jgi:DNA repair exonuclease SbcCD ATPase subunit